MSTNYTEQTWADGDATKPLSAARLTHIEDGIAAVDTAAQSAASTETTRATTAEGLLAPKASPALTGSPTAPTQAANDNSTKLATTAYADTAAGARLAKGNVVTKTSAYTAVVGDVILADTTTATFTVTIPAASGGKGRIVVKWVKGTTAPTINLTGTDHVNTSAGVQTFTPVLLNQGYQLESDGTALWAVTADDLPLSALDTRYAAAGATGGGAGLPSTIVTKTAAYTAAAGDFVEADTTSAGFTVTLPTALAAGALVAVKKVSADGNTLTIAPAGGGTIDGQATTTTVTQWAGVVLEHKGSNVWRVAASMTTTGPQGPTGAAGATGPQGATGATGPTGASGAIAQIQDEGSNVTVRPTVNFVGAGVTVTDDSGNTRTTVTIPGGGSAPAFWYGDGSDGAAVADGTTSIAALGGTATSNVYSLNRNAYFTDLTVNSGVTIYTNGWVLSAKGTLTNNGTIHNNGRLPGAGAGTATGSSPAADGSGTGNLGGGSGATNNFLGYGRGGGLAASTAGTAVSNTLGGAGGAGGSASGGGTAGGTGGTATALAAPSDGTRWVQFATTGNYPGTTVQGGAGGGGAANDGANQGGGGGGGGGVLVLNGYVIVNNGAIRARGAAGANAVAGNSGGGGGGGGGALIINTSNYSGSGSYDANGGAGGLKQGTGANGTAGSNGSARLNVWA